MKKPNFKFLTLYLVFLILFLAACVPRHRIVYERRTPPPEKGAPSKRGSPAGFNRELRPGMEQTFTENRHRVVKSTICTNSPAPIIPFP